MEVDLGGIGKEYAVDRAARMAAETATGAVVVNFGGDMHVAGPRRDGRAWAVGIERPGDGDQAVRRLEVMRGGVATSGDARRFLLKDGVRYPHVLNPRTGWPVMEAPRSVTVLADSCTEAGMLSTMAMLQGGDAESFLEEQGVRFWCIR
jgi:thiamine biosynthesis lipoprotein